MVGQVGAVDHCDDISRSLRPSMDFGENTVASGKLDCFVTSSSTSLSRHQIYTCYVLLTILLIRLMR